MRFLEGGDGRSHRENGWMYILSHPILPRRERYSPAGSGFGMLLKRAFWAFFITDFIILGVGHTWEDVCRSDRDPSGCDICRAGNTGREPDFFFIPVYKVSVQAQGFDCSGREIQAEKEPEACEAKNKEPEKEGRRRQSEAK